MGEQIISETRTKSFDYICDDNARVLILGTMPGIASIKGGEYYKHEDNLFWDIVFRVCNPNWKCDELVDEDYETKKRMLLDNKIALWDVLGECDRKGSLDKNIRNKVRNDFKTFFEKYKGIKTVFFNGTSAEKYFDELKPEPLIFNGRQFIRLQSTSPSNTANSFNILKEWMQIRNYINN